ncbi:hypothetical protein [Aeromicrobium endophyticum]|uniref:Uncharacterized protein n=1 Tax=Aeromicrobium endophyticum TaxID=2292704 RepID=A0A371PDD7_9ACTN|nr:hypothetical protein [Aeromicrobium endophyticum]REK73656.1 hypothetical protein DX116_09025 [Aeromicrobium endophyticum]
MATLSDEVTAYVLEQLAEQREGIVTFLRQAAEIYRPMTRGAVLELAGMVEEMGMVCSHCGAGKVEVRRSQDARRPIPCERQDREGAVVQAWSRHRFGTS